MFPVPQCITPCQMLYSIIQDTKLLLELLIFENVSLLPPKIQQVILIIKKCVLYNACIFTLINNTHVQYVQYVQMTQAINLNTGH